MNPRRPLKPALTALLVFLLSPTLSAQEAPPGPPLVALRAARLFDGKSAALLANAVVLIEGPRIKAVGSGLPVPAGARVMDLGDVTLLPGLIDAHSHLLANIDLNAEESDSILLMVTQLSPAHRALLGVKMGLEDLEAGITTVRDVGNSGVNGDIALRDAIVRGWVTGPRVLACTRALSPPGGQFGPLQPQVQGLIEQEYVTVTGAEEARRAVRQALNDGADCIKVIVDNDRSTLSAEELKAIVEEAHRGKCKVAAHATSELATRTAAEAGVDSIEHAYHVSDDTLQLMARKHIFLVATDMSQRLLYGERPIPNSTPELERRREAVTLSVRDRLQRALAAGVPIVAGSDMYYRVPWLTRGQASLKMLEALAAEGMTPAAVLRAATVSAAELLGQQDRIGSLEPKKLADIIAVPGNPLKDLTGLKHVQFVMKSGQVVYAGKRPAGLSEEGQQ